MAETIVPPVEAPGRHAGRLDFRRDVQALRGVAVLAVVLYHAGLPPRGGYVGVDVFFVISGFVIGRGLIDELRRTGTISLRSFYRRRAHRLLPALGLMLFVVLATTWLMAPVGAETMTARTGMAAALSIANVYLARVGGGYFDTDVELNPLLHTWSLSVEEQFYLALPLLLTLTWRLGVSRAQPTRAVRSAVIVTGGASFVVAFVCVLGWSPGPFGGEQFAFFSPVTRAWELAVGVGLVLLPDRWSAPRAGRRLVIAGGFSLIAAAVVLFDGATPFPGPAAVVPVAGAALVIWGGTPLRPRDRSCPDAHEPGPDAGLGGAAWRRPLERCGDLSYSWYLWHWPLIVAAGACWPSGGARVATAAALVSLGPAVLSYRYVERMRPGRHAGSGRRSIVVASSSVLASFVAVLIGAAVAPTMAARGGVPDLTAARALHADVAAGCDGTTPLGRWDDPAACRWGDATATATAALVGDSNAGQFTEAFIGAADADAVGLRVATSSACPFVLVPGGAGVDDSCRRFVEATVQALEADPPDVVVIGLSSDRYLERDAGWLSAALAAEPSRDALFADGLAEVANRLVAAGSRVALMDVVPKPRWWDPGRCSRLLVLVEPDGCGFSPFDPRDLVEIERANALHAAVADRTGAEVWSLGSAICPGDRCVSTRDGAIAWRDGGHLSVASAVSLTEEVAPLLAGAVHR